MLASHAARGARLALAIVGPAAAQMLPSEARLRARITRLVEITRASPRDVGSWHDLATLYRQVNEWDLAVAAETKAVEQHPRYAVAFWGRGKAHFGRRSFADARADFSAAIDLWQTRGGLEKYLTVERPPTELVDAYRTRSVAWAHEAKLDEAVADLSIAIRLQKDDARLHYERASLLEKAGKITDAVADYKWAGLLYLDGQALEQARECQDILRRLGAHDDAAALAKRIDDARPKSDLPR
jgi:tetratricopeptide (TPR) repeat protein